MLKDIDALFALAERWGTQHPVLAWIVMGYLGGVVAVARMYEKAGVPFTFGGFLLRTFTRGLVGIFVAICVYGGWSALGWSQSWGLLVGGVCGVFGTDILEAVLVMGLSYLRKRFGLPPQQPPAPGVG